MRLRPAVSLLCLALLLCVTAPGVATFRTQDSEKTKRQKEKLPIVDYNAPEPADPQERARRKKKGEKYDRATAPIDPAHEEIDQLEVVHFPQGTPALPVARSAAVVIGTANKARAHLSSDKSYVYSEFDVLVDGVLKDDARSPIPSGKTLAVERPGGKVRMPSGHVHVYRTTLDPLSVGCRYVLFLTRRGDDYHVFTAYRLEGGRVFPLDDFFTDYEGAEEEQFMRDLRHALSSVAERHDSATKDSTGTAVAMEPVDPVDPEPTPDPVDDCYLPAAPACVSPRNDQTPRFAPGTVTVTYNPDDFTAEQVQALRNGYMAWNNVGNVTFTEPTPSSDRPTGDSSKNTLHFEAQDQPTDHAGLPRDARSITNQTCTNGVCAVQSIVILKRGLPLTAKAYCQNGPGYIEFNDYEQLVAHEVGHPLGLRDTYTATAGSRGISIMDGNSYHLRDRIITECDRRAVIQIYPKPTPTPPPTPPCTDGDGDGWHPCGESPDCNDTNPNFTDDCSGCGDFERHEERDCNEMGASGPRRRIANVNSHIKMIRVRQCWWM